MIKTALLTPFCLLAFAFSSLALSAPVTLVDNKQTVSVVIDKNSVPVIHHAANMLIRDIEAVAGVKPSLLYHFGSQASQGATHIVAGTVGQSEQLAPYFRNGTLNKRALTSAWETYQIAVVENSGGHTILVAGSDRRGTAYGLLSLSRAIGVSPWVWWADVTPKKQFPLVTDITPRISDTPSVKYRGIFLNDEDWGLQIWAAKTYEPEVGDMGPKTYARIYELLLRLRANTIWPAMHKTTKPFYLIDGNKEMADEYAIVIGTSHAEPMLSNINGEWDNKKYGAYRYDNNAENIKQFFQRRVQETAGYEGIYTLGMRGEHDSPIITEVADMNGQVALMQQILKDQRSILSAQLQSDASVIPQVFIPYKEVLTYYQNGLKVPDDVTLMWTDDNYGYLRQLSNPQEQKREGGAGIYYHTSYWGRPHDYLWLNSTHPLLMWSEISKAYAMQARDMWILNAGDIKPHEYATELFMDMGWNMSAFAKSDAVYGQLAAYFARDINSDAAEALTRIFKHYYRLSFSRRPEFMAFSQVEPVTLPGKASFTQTHYGDEVLARAEQWEALIEQTEELASQIPAEQRDAFFQLAGYPIIAAGHHNLKWLYFQKNQFAAAQGRGDANWYANKMRESHKVIRSQTDYYNNALANGKWQHMMSPSPRNLPVFDLPSNAVPVLRNEPVTVVLEGFDMPVNNVITNSHADSLPLFNVFSRKRHYMDLSLNSDKPQKWQLTANKPWIRFSETQGDLTPEQPTKRIWITLDWDHVPYGKAEKEPPLGHDHQLIPPSYKVTGAIELTVGKQAWHIGVSAYHPRLPAMHSFRGYVEDMGYVSLRAGDYQGKTDTVSSRWQRINDFGYDDSVMLAGPYQTSVAAPGAGAELQYQVYTFNAGEAMLHVQAIPTHPMYEQQGVRVAVSVDGGAYQTLSFKTIGRSDKWKQNVLKNAAVVSVPVTIAKPGQHTISVRMIDPGVMLDSMLLDLGGWKHSYRFPEATYSPALARELKSSHE